MDERRCPVCGRMFAPRQAKQRYCGRTCYRLVNNARAVARKQAEDAMPDATERRASDAELDDMARSTASACRALGALTWRQRMRLEILFDTTKERG